MFKRFTYTPHMKIYDVMKRINDSRLINQNERTMLYLLNTTLVGPGILTDDEETSILFKLTEKGLIKLQASNGRFGDVRSFLDSENYFIDSGKIGIEIQPPFHSQLFWYRLRALDGDIWRITNPFWILFFLGRKLFWLLSEICRIISAHKLISLLISVLAILISLVVLDPATVKQNFESWKKEVVDWKL